MASTSHAFLPVFLASAAPRRIGAQTAAIRSDRSLRVRGIPSLLNPPALLTIEHKRILLPAHVAGKLGGHMEATRISIRLRVDPVMRRSRVDMPSDLARR